jgi:glucose/arabinose dehydrogenase
VTRNALLEQRTAVALVALLLVLVLSACSGPESMSSTSTPVSDISPAPENASPQPEATSEPVPDATVPAVETPAETPDPTVPAETEEPTPTPEGIPVATEPVANPTASPTLNSDSDQAFDPAAANPSFEQAGAGFEQPVFVTHAGDGSGTIYVLEKVGALRLLDGSLVLDIRDQVVQTGVFGYEHEQGMLGVAFHPQYASNGFFYVHYNNLDGDHVISRFTVGGNGVADPASEYVLLEFHQPEVNFQGGMLEFGADGYLYIGTGTGGAAVELQFLAQDLGSLYGKILRIDVDGGEPYSIPADNPFVGTDGALNEIWAYGLRNPWRFSFDRANGDLYIGGPGQFTEEWIDFQPATVPAGENFGWPIFEGTQCWDDWDGPCDPTGLRMPILTYPTYQNGNCVVIGGYVHRGSIASALNGAYFFGDFCSGNVWTGWRDASGSWQKEQVFQIPGLISSFGEDEAGELYICDINNGIVYRIIDA